MFSVSKDASITFDKLVALEFNYCNVFFLNTNQSLAAILIYTAEHCRIHYFLKGDSWKCCQKFVLALSYSKQNEKCLGVKRILFFFPFLLLLNQTVILTRIFYAWWILREIFAQIKEEVELFLSWHTPRKSYCLLVHCASKVHFSFTGKWKVNHFMPLCWE